MGTLIVVILSLLVGAATYAATIRSGRRAPVAVGFEGSSSSFEDSPSATATTHDLAPVVPEPIEDEAVAGDVVDLDAARSGATDLEPEAPAPTAVLTPSNAVVTDPEPLDPDYTYLRVAVRGPSWRDRVAGVAGIVVLVVASAGVLAFGVYQLGHLINATVERFLGN